MKRFLLALPLLHGAFYALAAAAEEAEEMAPLVVEGGRVADVSATQVKSADLAEALFKNLPGVSLVRRSGIANDIILRGQKKDNINILVDGAKIYGACPNRMDPPTSHILTSNVEAVDVVEGPYDVENFGTLSGAVEVTTREPEAGLHGNLQLNLGRWNYRKAVGTLSGGNDRVRALATFSHEESDPYEDGDGNDFMGQMRASTTSPMTHYKPEYQDLKAYKKRSFLGKLIFDLTTEQQLKLSYTANRSDDILYPSTPMDALYDDSDIWTLDYSVRDLGRWSRLLEVSLYYSRADHPMSNFYRNASGPGSANQMTNHMKSRIGGFRLKNAMEMDEASELRYGIDASRRNWDGVFEGSGTMAGITGIKGIDDVDTDNLGLFVEYERDFDRFNLKLGGRYDDTRIEPGTGPLPRNDYHGVSAFALGTWQWSQTTRLFGGIGRSHRVPDARELYYRMAPMMPGGMPMVVGNPNLDQTSNTEVDLGVKTDADNLSLDAKIFYSRLGDFIFYNDSKMMYRFENMDATLWGFSLNGSWNLNADLWLDFGIAYQRGRKKDPLSGQSDTDMPEIPPLKGNLAVNWQYAPGGVAKAEVVASDAWTHFDADNGEQRLSGWGTVNLNVRHRIGEHLRLVGGIDNLFDKSYAVSNTYKDLSLITAGGGEVMLLNEPGRYYYLNASISF